MIIKYTTYVFLINIQKCRINYAVADFWGHLWVGGGLVGGERLEIGQWFKNQGWGWDDNGPNSALS